jgi:hypothetical protein
MPQAVEPDFSEGSHLEGASEDSLDVIPLEGLILLPPEKTQAPFVLVSTPLSLC